MNSKRGQIAIFVIIAIFLVVVIALFFLIDRKPEISRGQDFDNPESFIDSCVKDAFFETTKEIFPQGGFENPVDYELHEGDKVAYICKNIRLYEPCVNQYPLYMKSVDEELEKVMKYKAGQCFALLEEELGSRNYDVTAGNLDVDITLKPDVVEINLIRDFTMSREGVTRNYDNFRVFVRNPAYDLLFVAAEIASQEAGYCHFSNDGFMILYPKFDIRKLRAGESKIYTIEHKESLDKLKIAIRGCVIPPGL